MSAPLREPPVLPSIKRFNSREKVLLEKRDATDPLLLTKSLIFYGPRSFVMVFTRGRHSSVPILNQINPICTLIFSSRTIFRRVRRLAETISVVMSVRPNGTIRLPLDGLSWNLIFEYFFSKSCPPNSSFLQIWQITGNLHDALCTFMISRSVFRRMRNVSDKSCRQNQNTLYVQ